MTDLEELPAEYVAQLQSRGAALAAQHEAVEASDQDVRAVLAGYIPRAPADR